MLKRARDVALELLVPPLTVGQPGNQPLRGALDQPMGHASILREATAGLQGFPPVAWLGMGASHGARPRERRRGSMAVWWRGSEGGVTAALHHHPAGREAFAAWICFLANRKTEAAVWAISVQLERSLESWLPRGDRTGPMGAVWAITGSRSGDRSPRSGASVLAEFRRSRPFADVDRRIRVCHGPGHTLVVGRSERGKAGPTRVQRGLGLGFASAAALVGLVHLSFEIIASSNPSHHT